MRGRAARAVVGWLCGALGGLWGPALAAAQAPALTPPRLIEDAAAEYPPDAVAEGRAPTVLLLLEIDAQGRVTDAQVVEPAGDGFDEAAQRAALRFRFEPARRGETPIASRIQFRYRFEPPAEPAPTADAPPSDRGPAAQDEAGPASPGDAADGDAADRDAADGAAADGAAADGAAADGAAADGDAADGDAAAGDAADRDTPRETPNGSTVAAAGDEAELGVTASVVRDRADELRRSSEAVNAVDVAAQQARARDVGDVLARESGVIVRRSGGLGSRATINLQGLTQDQVRFFVDGVPIEASGYPFGLANLSVNLVERLELYRGVSPLRFGADALGGLINLVRSDDFYQTGAFASYRTGSFGTYRGTLTARYHDEGSGFYAALDTQASFARNDYWIDVEVPDARGRLSPATIQRFHDAYLDWRVALETGFVRQPWARRLSLSLFAAGVEQDLQHNVVMTVPYGDARFGESALGGTLRYEQPELLGDNTHVEVVANLSRSEAFLDDTGEFVYDWFGRRVRERRQPGELAGQPLDRRQFAWRSFNRVYARWAPHPDHELRLSVVGRVDSLTGDDRLIDERVDFDPLTVQRDLYRVYSGLGYRLSLFDGRLENTAFVKHYSMVVLTDEPLPGGTTRERDSDRHRVGVGDSLVYRFADWIWAKASYELTTRLPDPEEIFGDGQLVVANLDLEPESSHNLNVGLNVDWRDRELGHWTGEVNLFARFTDQQILLLGNDTFFSFQNVFAARTLGAELQLGWVSPGRYVRVRLNGTYFDARNTSSEGTFGAFDGDRLPNRPYLTANGEAELRWPDLLVDGDAIALSWDTRYVHGFFRSWESQGLREFKQTVDAQLVHGIALTYRLADPLPFAATLEVQNLTDEDVFDFFGVQRPGRSVFLKLTAELR